MSLSLTQNRRGHLSSLGGQINQGWLEKREEICPAAPSNCEGDLDPFHSCSSILFQFSSEEFAKIKSMKTLWNIQCEINPISLKLIFHLVDLAVGAGQNKLADIVYQNTKVTQVAVGRDRKSLKAKKNISTNLTFYIDSRGLVVPVLCWHHGGVPQSLS